MNSFRDHFITQNYTAAVDDGMNRLLDSKAFEAIHVIGLSLAALGQHQQAVEWLATSLACPMPRSTWFSNAAIVLKNTEHALRFLQRGLILYPNDADLHGANGFCMAIAGRWDEAIMSFDKATIDSTYVTRTKDYHLYKGYCFFMLENHDEAIALWRLVSEPSSDLICTWAWCLLCQAKNHKALALLENYHFDPEPSIVTYNKSLLHLGMGNWPQAWHLHRARHELPPVSLDDLRDKHLLLVHEQGLGDCLMFVRYAEVLRPLVRKLTLVVPPALLRLMRHFQLNASFDVQIEQTDKGIVIPMMDAPAMLETTLATIPRPVPFALPQNLHRLPDDERLKIGLVWTGAAQDDPEKRATAKRRNMVFETMRPLLDHSDRCMFVSLQMPDHHVDDDRLIQPLQDDFDILDTATIIQQLDLVITVDSMIAHLAGTLEKPVWMLSRFDGEWRWLWDEREDSPWYPTMHIYRQKSPAAWPEVIARVSDDLLNFKRG